MAEYLLGIGDFVNPIIGVNIDRWPGPVGQNLFVGGQLDCSLDVVVDYHWHIIKQ